MYYLKELLIITTITQMVIVLQLLNSTEYVSYQEIGQNILSRAKSVDLAV